MKKLSMWDKIKYRYDWNSILKGLGMFFFISAFFALLFNRSYLGMIIAGKDKSGITTGYIVNRIEHTDFRQTVVNGNHYYVDKIFFYYRYDVNGITYYGRQPVSYSIEMAQEINKARKGPMPYPITIRYDESNPSQSII